ncbi:rRNA pseudouridine synthase [Macrococcoides goetzii]|nr:pseudouridine synthase [Macrococcus goetzii]TDM39716.1 rRNA pseudouridine synthase [Macrococcus goetzii]TDM46195.1 rRNA pseudouridine synthase [Macrococcus goetzii]TDM49681.1 rRNA pseudouridine synthase [Macrococcus goetzii]
MRLDKFLSNHGVGSRKDVKAFLKKKVITVNEEVVTKSDIKINPEKDIIKVQGEMIHFEPFIYLMLNKPAGVVSSTHDKDKTVIDLITGLDHYDLHPVGRLDKDTEGLLIITNDGKFSHDVLSPKKHVNKTYYAKIDGIVTDHTVEQFAQGVTLDDGYHTMPGDLTCLSVDTNNNTSEIELVIQEGKFHQVKRMFETVSMKVTYLKRIKMGDLSLDSSLKPGEYKKLMQKEINLVRK